MKIISLPCFEITFILVGELREYFWHLLFPEFILS